MKFIVKWLWKITRFIEVMASIMENVTSHRLEMAGVPESQWQSIREGFLSTQQLDGQNETETKEEDPFIAEARKLVGDDIT